MALALLNTLGPERRRVNPGRSRGEPTRIHTQEVLPQKPHHPRLPQPPLLRIFFPVLARLLLAVLSNALELRRLTSSPHKR